MASQGQEQDASQRMVSLCLTVSAQVNRAFAFVIGSLQVLILPQWSKYERSMYTTYALQVLSCDMMMLSVAKTLQVYFRVSNFLLLLSLGSLGPFIGAVRNIWKFIPCPPMAATISNAALAFVLVILGLTGLSTYGAARAWRVYSYMAMIWPWLVLTSIVSRLYIERNISQNPFSPVREMPLLGILGAAACILMLLAVKDLSVSDCFVLTMLDSMLCGLACSALLGKSRRKLHFRAVKVYVLIAALVLLYDGGESGVGSAVAPQPPCKVVDAIGELEGAVTGATGESYAPAPAVANHMTLASLPADFPGFLGDRRVLFIIARLMLAVRSALVKRYYAAHAHALEPDDPPTNALMFFFEEEPKKHRFARFPAPVLTTLDAIFDSGLRDIELHGMGPMGTRDIFMLTENTYLLPVASLMTFAWESGTMDDGILPPVVTDASRTASGAEIAEQAMTSFDVVQIIAIFGLFTMARMLKPAATARALFDRSSSVHTWRYQPLLVATPFFLYDVLYLNESISKFQIVIVICLVAIVAQFRDNLWTRFKRKYLVLRTQELHYHQPSALRKLQKNTLLEFLAHMSTDDYGFMLLDTAVRHGNNVRELARDTSMSVWDPSPTATASWKLAFSLVTKSLKKQNLMKKRRQEARDGFANDIRLMLLGIADSAVDQAAAHGKRLQLAAVLATTVSKRRALRRLRLLAERRRALRMKRRNGQLAKDPMVLATACGTLRTLADVGDPSKPPTFQTSQKSADTSMASLMKNRSARPKLFPQSGDDNLALTGSPGASIIQQQESTLGTSVPRVPGAVYGEDDDEEPLDLEAALETSLVCTRGVWAAGPEGGQPAQGSCVLAFGDHQRGQLARDPRSMGGDKTFVTISCVEELRNHQIVQVEASGVASFVLTAKGQVYGFGSNRSMELGNRKEVTQVHSPQRVKTLREHKIVQIVTAKSASGSAFSIGLSAAGEVLTFGTSACGALGQGPDCRQTAPLSLRMTRQVRIRSIVAGARHSILLSDDGRLFSFGDNTHGQLGLGTKARSGDTPVAIEGPLKGRRVSLAAAGDCHNLAATTDGHIYAWGANASGQLGLHRMDDQNSPQNLQPLRDASVISLACGARHSVVVGGNGTQVWSFGSNVQGQLGVGNMAGVDGANFSTPTLCKALSGQPQMEVVQVAAAAGHTLAVTRVGEVYGWGDNTYGQLGYPPAGLSDAGAADKSRREAALGATAPSAIGRRAAKPGTRLATEIDAPLAFSQGVGKLLTPTRVVALSLYQVQSVATADTHTLALAK